jgi:hypothetical protein
VLISVGAERSHLEKAMIEAEFRRSGSARIR